MRLAAQNVHLNVVKYLVESEKIFILQHEYYVELAAKRDHLNVVKYLVESGASIHEYSVILAAENGHLDVVQYLVGLCVASNIRRNNDYFVKLASENAIWVL